MASVVRTTVKVILPYIKTKLIDEAYVDADSQVAYTTDPRGYTRHYKGEFYVLFVPGSERLDAEGMDANGRHDRRVIRMLNIHLRTRLNQDMARQHKEQLLDADLGHLLREDTLCDLLDYFSPTDDSNNVLVYEPMQQSGISHTYPLGDGWVESVVSFNVPYVRAYTDADRNYY